MDKIKFSISFRNLFTKSKSDLASFISSVLYILYILSIYYISSISSSILFIISPFVYFGDWLHFPKAYNTLAGIYNDYAPIFRIIKADRYFLFSVCFAFLNFYYQFLFFVFGFFRFWILRVNCCNQLIISLS